MTDNFKNYRDFINLCGGLPDNNEKGNLDKYYVIELMRRGKDNPDMPAANYHFKNYYIYSWKDLDKYEAEIKDICTLLRLRAYCSVNYKSMAQVALDTMAESARRLAAHDYKKFYNIFESCSGKYVDKSNNVWIIDIDRKLSMSGAWRITDYIERMESKWAKKVIYQMPTKSGVHLLTHTFNLQKFNEGFLLELGDIFDEVPDVKKNHLTLLYENL